MRDQKARKRKLGGLNGRSFTCENGSDVLQANWREADRHRAVFDNALREDVVRNNFLAVVTYKDFNWFAHPVLQLTRPALNSPHLSHRSSCPFFAGETAPPLNTKPYFCRQLRSAIQAARESCPNMFCPRRRTNGS